MSSSNFSKQTKVTDDFKVWQAKRKQARLETRNKNVGKLIKEITDKIYANVSFTFDDMCETVSRLIQERNIKLSDSEIKRIVDVFYNKEKPTSERLDKADQFFQVLHRANEIIKTSESTIGLYYD